ncbi:hypothetical protein MKW98_011889 [Papaver atlanticum]|uniref:Uncharacterized protein n=1 Tax=Papaver atlanticum TaxID=357466 RepID=A0AAD4T3J6_9MAGN|nr:hypothetical protein MKW98_011889 [Papaver atlanticum]
MNAPGRVSTSQGSQQLCQCRFIAKLQREGQMRGLNRWFGRWRKVSRDVMRFKVKVRQPGSQSKWLHRQREVARALMNRLDRKGFRNLYRVREEQLASAISMVNYSHSNSQSLSIAHDVVRYLQQCFRKDYSVWKQCV